MLKSTLLLGLTLAACTPKEETYQGPTKDYSTSETAHHRPNNGPADVITTEEAIDNAFEEIGDELAMRRASLTDTCNHEWRGRAVELGDEGLNGCDVKYSTTRPPDLGGKPQYDLNCPDKTMELMRMSDGKNHVFACTFKY